MWPWACQQRQAHLKAKIRAVKVTFIAVLALHQCARRPFFLGADVEASGVPWPLGSHTFQKCPTGPEKNTCTRSHSKSEAKLAFLCQEFLIEEHMMRVSPPTSYGSFSPLLHSSFCLSSEEAVCGQRTSHEP
ncbi:hypothetical protein AAY473_030508 [Plecturocebus cupreus]